MVVGTYEFTAEKQGFEITLQRRLSKINVRPTCRSKWNRYLPRYLRVEDNTGETVEDAVVNTVKSDDGTVKTTTTGVNGDY